MCVDQYTTPVVPNILFRTFSKKFTITNNDIEINANTYKIEAFNEANAFLSTGSLFNKCMYLET